MWKFSRRRAKFNKLYQISVSMWRHCYRRVQLTRYFKWAPVYSSLKVAWTLVRELLRKLRRIVHVYTYTYDHACTTKHVCVCVYVPRALVTKYAKLIKSFHRRMIDNRVEERYKNPAIHCQSIRLPDLVCSQLEKLFQFPPWITAGRAAFGYVIPKTTENVTKEPVQHGTIVHPRRSNRIIRVIRKLKLRSTPCKQARTTKYRQICTLAI